MEQPTTTATAVGVGGSLASGVFSAAQNVADGVEIPAMLAVIQQTPWWVPLACATLAVVPSILGFFGRIISEAMADRRSARLAASIIPMRTPIGATTAVVASPTGINLDPDTPG